MVCDSADCSSDDEVCWWLGTAASGVSDYLSVHCRTNAGRMVMKMASRKALRLASEYSNRQYKVSREIANGLGIVHKPRWRQFTITSRRYRKFMYGQFGPIGIHAGGYKQ